MTKVFNIAVIPGDGIGTEVVAEGVKILKQIQQLDSTIKFNLFQIKTELLSLNSPTSLGVASTTYKQAK